MIKRIGVFGVGGVGGFFGGKLCRIGDPGVSVSFFARGEHLKAIQENGLTLKAEKEGVLLCRPALATDRMDRMPDLDLCILCVKGFDLVPLLRQLKDRVTENTILLPLLNGVDVYERIRSVIDKGIVLPACVYVGTHVERPGVVVQDGGACKILVGADPGRPDFSGEALLSLFRRAGILHEWSDDIQVGIWEKFIFIASFGLVTASSGKTIGEVLEDEALRADVLEIVGEIIQIANKARVRLPSDVAESALRKGTTFPFDTKTSFQRDFELANRKDERDFFGGSILNLANRYRLGTPKTQALLDGLERIKPSPED